VDGTEKLVQAHRDFIEALPEGILSLFQTHQWRCRREHIKLVKRYLVVVNDTTAFQAL